MNNGNDMDNGDDKMGEGCRCQYVHTDHCIIRANRRILVLMNDVILAM